MLRHRIVYSIALIISLITFFAANNQAALILFLALIIGGALSFLLLAIGKSTTVNIEVVPRPNNELSQGADVHISVSGRKIIPLESIKLVLGYENNLYGTHEEKEFFLRPGSGEHSEYVWDWNGIDCGNYSFRVDKIRIYDIFGIWTLGVRRSSDFNILSYPYVPNLDILSDDLSRSNNEGEKFDLYSSGHDVTEVHDLRDYHEGDSLGSIHWKLSGKLDKLVVREFGKPTNDKTAILCHGSFPGYENQHGKVDAVIGLSAAISQGLIKKNIVHHISVIQKEEIIPRPIYEEKETLDAISDILRLSLKDSGDVLSVVRVNDLTERVILITGELEEELMATLSEKINLTVILVNDGDKEYVDEREKFKIISLPLKKLDRKLHQLEL